MSRTVAKRQLTLNLRGRLSQDQLDQLCLHLGLTAVGTADDPVGSELAHRIHRHPRYSTLTVVIIAVVRAGVDEWTLTVDVMPGPDAGRWCCLAELGARAAGLTITDRKSPALPSDHVEADESTGRVGGMSRIREQRE